MKPLAFTAIESCDDAVAVTQAIVQAARRTLCIYSRELDPGLFDATDVLEGLRRFAESFSGNVLVRFRRFLSKGLANAESRPGSVSG